LAVACAIGSPSINLIPARIESNALVMSDPRILLSLEGSSLGPDRKVVLGVRPESLRVVSGEEQSSSGLEVTANPVEIRRDIHGWRVRAEIGQLTIHGETSDGATDGLSDNENTIRLRANVSQLHFFDASTGQRLEDVGTR
jgi:ABC-type sugar transport system ATPase subunit